MASNVGMRTEEKGRAVEVLEIEDEDSRRDRLRASF